MNRRFGVNIVFFGNIINVFRGVVFGSWNLKFISDSLSKTSFGLMLVPLRGMKSLSYREIPNELILTFEEAWNIAGFWPAFKKLFNKRIIGILLSGSKTGKKASGFSYLDKVAGDNVQANQGTLVDWILFGGSKAESKSAVARIATLYPGAIKSSHGLLKSPKSEVREIHPEMRREFELIKERISMNLHIHCHYEVRSEISLIKESDNFIDYLAKSNLYYCLDIFHALQRGSRDGSNPNPVVDSTCWIDFLSVMKDKVKEVHFRLDKDEVELIRKGKATEVKTYLPMCYMYLTYQCDFIYELYPNLFISTGKSIELLQEVHECLVSSFHQTLPSTEGLSPDEVCSLFRSLQKTKNLSS